MAVRWSQATRGTLPSLLLMVSLIGPAIMMRPSALGVRPGEAAVAARAVLPSKPRTIFAILMILSVGP